MTTAHPIVPEELMAHLDGELSPEQTTATATHLENCMECQQLAADLRGLSQQVQTWEVAAPASSQIPSKISAALAAREAERMPVPAIPMPWNLRFRQFFKRWTPALAVCAIAALVIVGTQTTLYRSASKAKYVRVSEPRVTADQAVPPPPPPPPPIASPATSSSPQTSPDARLASGNLPGITLAAPGVVADSNGLSHGIGDAARNSFSRDSQPITDQVYSYDSARPQTGQGSGAGNGPINGRSTIAAQLAPSSSAPVQEQSQLSAMPQQTSNAVSGSPLVIRTATLALTTKDFDKARAQVENILKHHRGYVGSLNVTANPGAGRTLSGSLRIPSPQLDAALAELKTLGRLDSESQNGEDVTAQYVDLNARLDNSRHTEQRLTDLLANRTGKLSDVLAVENELARVRGEIESMEAERKSMANQVDFATVNLTINEDYRAQLQVVPPSTFNRLSNAAVSGYRNLTDGLMSCALFFLSSGPSLLFWIAVFFFPARFAWKRLRRNLATDSGVS